MIAPLILLLATTFGGCSIFTNAERPAPVSVKVTDQCARLGQPVPLPVPKEGVDLGDIAAENRAAAITANKKIVGRDRCETKVRAGLVKGGG